MGLHEAVGEGGGESKSVNSFVVCAVVLLCEECVQMA